MAIPVGELFGTTFLDYAKWAARGFADPAAYILHCRAAAAGWNTRAGPSRNFAPAFLGALLLALAIVMKPIVLPAAAVILGGASVATLVSRQWRRAAGLCIGFVPVLSMALHNWIYGHCLRAAERECRPPRRAGDAALRLCPGVRASYSL